MYLDSKVLHKFTYGLYVVSSGMGTEKNGQIANTVFQVTAEPPQIALSINKKNLTHEYLEKYGLFAVSILSRETPMTFIGNFGFRSGRDFDKFEGVHWEKGVTGAPVVLENALACVEGKIVGRFDCGTHTLFVGLMATGKRLAQGEPMTYDYYHQVKGGTAPKTAPTYIAERKRASAEDGGMS